MMVGSDEEMLADDDDELEHYDDGDVLMDAKGKGKGVPEKRHRKKVGLRRVLHCLPKSHLCELLLISYTVPVLRLRLRKPRWTNSEHVDFNQVRRCRSCWYDALVSPSTTIEGRLMMTLSVGTTLRY